MRDDAGRQFMAQSRYAHLSVPDQQRGIPAPPLAWTFDPSLPRVPLPPAAALALAGCQPRELMEQRASLRHYSPAPLTVLELSFLLWCTQGVKRVGPAHTLRTVPSAGARHPLETMVWAPRVGGLAPALYAYEALHHRLVELRRDPDLGERLVAACHGQAFVGRGAAVFVWIAVPYRTTWRYAERGYRYLHLDAGHVCQNLYLAAEAIGGGACAVAAFDDDALNELVAVDPQEAFVIYVGVVGKRPATA